MVKQDFKIIENWLHPSARYILPRDEKAFIGWGPDFDTRLQSVLAAPDVSRLRLSLCHQKADAFLRKAGWHICRKTVLCDVASAPENPLTHYGDGFVSLPLDRPHSLWQDWAEAHYHYYKRTHLDNPVRALNHGEMRRVFAGDDLMDGDAVACVEGGVITGFASLRARQKGRIEAGWLWSKHGPHGLMALWQWLAHRADGAVINLEADDTDADLCALLGLLDTNNQEQFWTWEKR